MARALARRGDVDALRFTRADGAPAAWTYAELSRRVDGVARGLVALGVRPGDRVVVLADNRPEWVVADVAIALAGAVSVPVYHVTTRDELAYVAGHSGARMAIVEGAEELALARAAAPELGACAVMDATGGADAQSLEDVARLGEERAPALPDPGPGERFTIMYTSGTTGAPKGCVHTHASYSAALVMTAELGSIRESDLSYLYLPLSHVMGREVLMLALAVGATTQLCHDRDRLLDELGRARPTFFAGVPRVYEKAVAAARRRLAERGLALDPHDVARARAARLAGGAVEAAFDDGPARVVRDVFGGRLREAWIGAAPMHPDLLDVLFACGVPAYVGYGMTETAAACTLGTRGSFKLGSAGRALPGVELAIADGELLVGGPSVFSEYYRDPAATAAVLRDGWLHTGDLATVDEDGFLILAGRKKDLVITSHGKTIAPHDWQNAVCRSPYVDDAVVIGDGRPYLVALVVPDFDAIRADTDRLALGDLRTQAELAAAEPVVREVAAAVETANRERPRYAQVRRFALLDRLLSADDGELTPTGKIRRDVVAERNAARLEALYRDG
jgi:long-chain acyl-CoA synthetase